MKKSLEQTADCGNSVFEANSVVHTPIPALVPPRSKSVATGRATAQEEEVMDMFLEKPISILPSCTNVKLIKRGN